MKYFSTRNKLESNINNAVLKGLAADGGLFMPEQIPVLPKAFFDAIEEKTLPEIGFTIAKAFLEDSVPDEVLKPMMEEVLNFEIPAVKVEENIYSLELFHGPTMAFKDVGARFMARLMSYFSEGKPMRVIAATSGDTGSAVASGFFEVEGIDVFILYPEGKVSPLQEKQLTTWGKNIKAFEIKGAFDDCQAIAKQLLGDEELKKQFTLTSANSINIARLIPQSIYYFWAYAQLKKLGKPIVFSVPSGNFGNLTAGLFAYKMGLPVEKFVASTNINNIIPKYLESGKYEPKESQQTISNAMDVGNPSNYERMKDLFHDKVESFREIILGYDFTDDQTKEAIKEVYNQTKYILDPHGAVAYLGLDKYFKNTESNAVGVLLETAHPAKFLEVVEETLQQKITIPEKLEAFNRKEKKSIKCSKDYDEVKKIFKEI